MADQRVKGQEVEVLIVADNQPQDAWNFVQNFEANFDIERMEEGYLGKTANDFDEVYKGTSGKFDVHYNSAKVFDLITAIVNRARRRNPAIKINIKATLNFPNGTRRRVLFPDCFFGGAPLSFGGRTEYGKLSLDFACSTPSFL